MYMLALVSSGSTIRILYLREYFDSWADPLDLSKYHKMLMPLQLLVEDDD